MARPSRDALKKKFKKFDENGDGQLEKEELGQLLRKGNPDISNHQINILFKLADTNHDGIVDFNEFVDFIYSDSASDVSVAHAHDGSKHHRAMHKNPEHHCISGVEESGLDWKVVEPTFLVYSKDGKMSGLDFSRLCRESGMHDGDNFGPPDVEIVFATVLPRGEHYITKKEFRKAMTILADRKQMPVTYIRGLVQSCGPPELHHTHAEHVRLAEEGCGSHQMNHSHRNSQHNHTDEHHDKKPKARTSEHWHPGHHGHHAKPKSSEHGHHRRGSAASHHSHHSGGAEPSEHHKGKGHGHKRASTHAS